MDSFLSITSSNLCVFPGDFDPRDLDGGSGNGGACIVTQSAPETVPTEFDGGSGNGGACTIA
ncbi:hypothetical protein BD410DRAFT_792208 [Rickenella mellea]|uniref:Uncharacterized protein n=1 Tax=Rickenella mellea TaxID=50990 RepID=A0A4Y7PWI3_9AGAM|nr:hypothetical protein BD410DRAFT_792208 [Rickenella mellea]